MATLFYSFKITTAAIFQIFLLGLCGFVLTKKNIISQDNLKFLSRLVIFLFFSCFIFVKLIENFNFCLYPNWWIFPLISFVVTLLGFLTGLLFLRIDKNLNKFKNEFLSLVTFQNSGYLPLILVAFLLPPDSRDQMFIYLFLFLLGFNLIMWSIGVFYLVRERNGRFELSSLFSPPVITMIITLFLIAIGFSKFIPIFLIEPMKMLGDCALPLAILIVGGNLAQVNISTKKYSRYISSLVIAKLLFLPFIFFGLIFLIKPQQSIAFLLLLEGAMPSATSLSVIMRHYDREDNIISLGIFWTHLFSLLTIPLFLILFSAFRIFIIR